MPKLTTVRIGSFVFTVDDQLWAQHARHLATSNFAQRMLLAYDIEEITHAKYPAQVARFTAKREAMAEQVA